MSIKADIDFGPAQEAMAALLERFGDLTDVSDINIGTGGPAVRRIGVSEPVDIKIPGEEIAELAFLMASAFDTEINEERPILEKRLPPRYRVTVSYPTIERDGHWDISIRFLPDDVIPLTVYVQRGELDQHTAERLVELALTRNTMLVAGRMGAGKTTLLRSIAGEIPVSQRLIVIEDRPELQIMRDNMTALVTNDNGEFEALIEHSMSKDGDIIIIGEVRGRSASRFLTVASAGHPCLTSIQGDQGRLALVRMLRLVRLVEPNFDRKELEGSVQAVCHVGLNIATKRREITLTELKHEKSRRHPKAPPAVENSIGSVVL